MEKDIKSEFNKLHNTKTNYTLSAETLSELTKPKIFPIESIQNGQKLKRQYQSIGNEGVEILTSKVTSTIFNKFGIALETDEITLHQLNNTLDELTSMVNNIPQEQMPAEERQKILYEINAEKKTKGKISKTLARIERMIQQKILTKGMVNKFAFGIQHFFITGNVAWYVNNDFSTRIYNLRDFVSRRDREGKLLKVIGKEKVYKNSLEQEIIDKIEESNNDLGVQDDLDLYTVATWNPKNKKWEIEEWIEDVFVDEWKLKNCPFIVPFTDYEIGNTYNYAYCEQARGDLQSLDMLEKNFLESSASAARTIFMVRPNATTSLRDLQSAENLSFITGNAEDVTILRGADVQTLSITQNHITTLRRQLERFFLMNVSVQRAGERVTAEEINRMLADIEDSLGNLYSILSEEILLPLAKIVIEYLRKDGKLEELDDGIELKIITGADAVRKQTAYAKLQQFISTIYNLKLNRFVNTEELISRMAVSLNIETDGLIKSSQVVAQEQQQDMQAQLQMQQAQEQIKQPQNQEEI